MEYIFTLKFRLPDDGSNGDELADRLGAGACDDALLGLGQPGRIALEFTRDAATAQDAMVSALADVKQAIPGVKLIEAAPDFVGLTDAAEAVGVTRQNMRKLMLNHAHSFPAPVHGGSAAIWHLVDILSWLQARGNYKLEQSLIDVAKSAMQINFVTAARDMGPEVHQDLFAAMA